MKISIAMATYNGAKYLEEQIDSFLHQTRQPDELVVCDDGSTDATLEILEEFRQRAPFPVHIYRNENNLGYIKNFEKALSLCSGDIIFLSDQDDVWLGKKIEAVEEEFLSNPNVMAIVNDQYVTDSKLECSAHTSLGNIKAAGVGESWFVAGCCTSIRRPLLRVVLPIPQDAHGHDAWINKLAEALSVRAVLAAPLQYYRRHGENTSQSFASNLGKVSSLDLIKHYGFRDARAGWQCDAAHYERYRTRINDRIKELGDIGLESPGEFAIKSFSEKIAALRGRIAIASTPRVMRLPHVVRYWASGGYKHFSGWKSAAKDILRP
jgi:glycosyltransferase involved in cell wall biosynthesis